MPVPPGSPSPQLHDLPLRARPVEPQNPYLPFPREAADRSLPDYFEEVVERNIQRLAVRTGQVDLTYGELNVRANRIARLLLARSPDRDEPAALLFGHGSAAIPALIGVLKSGKPYTA
ncbi:MAG: hypothetical protein K0Q72_361, partial [Armatimonadetes bacterium]|nr:hypothetical protein [Armatimonadota bacterium]